MWWRSLIAVLGFCSLAVAQRYSEFSIPRPLAAGSTLVVGFLGGFERWDDSNRSVRKLVLRLRTMPGVYAESCENHRRKNAMKLIREALDQNRNGKLETNEAGAVRVVLLGQSWGGASVIKTARDLKKQGVPVSLTVQVDSVGRGDDRVPANVSAAVNFYQHELFTVNGESEIKAEDASRTRILANRRFYYLPFIGPSSESWVRRKFGGAHAKMEADPVVWDLVEGYVRDAVYNRLAARKDIP